MLNVCEFLFLKKIKVYCLETEPFLNSCFRLQLYPQGLEEDKFLFWVHRSVLDKVTITLCVTQAYLGNNMEMNRSLD